MKRIFWLFLLLPFSLFAQEHFYYYKEKKQYLELDTNYVFVSTINNVALQKSNLMSNAVLRLNKEQHTGFLKYKQNIAEDFYWTEMHLLNVNPGKTYINKIVDIKKINGIQTVSPYFKGKAGEKIGLSNFFYVKLKSLSDTTLLYKFSTEKNVIVIKQDRFMLRPIL